MLREFVDTPAFDRKTTPKYPVATTALRAFIAYCAFTVTTAEPTQSTLAEEPSRQTVQGEKLDTREKENSYASIEEWLERNPIALRAKKALKTLHDLDNDEPWNREHATAEITESLQAMQANILPIPEEFMQPLRKLHAEARNNRNTEVFLQCDRIIKTLEMHEIDAPSTIPSQISYQPEAFKDTLSTHLGLTIDGLTEELSTLIINQLSTNTRTPSSILSILIQEDFFIEIEPNGGNVRLRRRVSSDDQQEAFDSGSICLITTLNKEDNYRETDVLRPRNRGPLLAVHPLEDQRFYVSTLLHRVYDLVTQSSDYRKGKHSVALARPKNYATEVQGPDLPTSAAHVYQYCCVNDMSTVQLPLGFVHARHPSQLPLKQGIQKTPLLSIQTERKNGTITITMTPQVQHGSDIVSHSNICCLAGWSRFSSNGEKLPARMSMQNDTIIWTIDKVPDDQSVNLHTYLGMDVSSAKLPSHP